MREQNCSVVGVFGPTAPSKLQQPGAPMGEKTTKGPMSRQVALMGIRQFVNRKLVRVSSGNAPA